LKKKGGKLHRNLLKQKSAQQKKSRVHGDTILRKGVISVKTREKVRGGEKHR